jgi:hypothetical protein
MGRRDCGTSLERPARCLGPKGCGDRLGADPTERMRMCFHTAELSSAPLPGFRAFRRLSKDYEVLPSSEEAWIYIAMIRIMLRRLAQNSS